MKNNLESHKTPINYDFGVDIITRDNKIAIQCKYWTNAVGLDAVQQIFSGAKFYDAQVPIVVSNNTFTNSAKILANKLKVKLITLPFYKNYEHTNIYNAFIQELNSCID
jgi:HJR/Mrr/RecB family endonuclease